MKYLLACLFVPFTLSARAEEYLAFSTVDLVYLSRYVVEVKPLRIRNEQYRLTGSFQVLDVLQGPSSELGDTIRVDLSMYDWPEADTAGCRAFLFLNAYGDDVRVSTFHPVSSGIRFFKNGKPRGLVQSENPGPFRFSSWDGGPSPEQLRALLREYVQRMAFLRTLMELEPAWVRNDSIFSWIDRHRPWFTIDQNARPLFYLGFSPALEDPLGLMRVELFNRIINGGIPDDAWRAIRLFHALMPEEDIFIPDGRSPFSNEEIPPPFGSPEGVLFLTKILETAAAGDFEEQQARRHLNDALQLEIPVWVPAETGYTIRLIRQALGLLQPGNPFREAGLWTLAGMIPDSARLPVLLIDSIHAAATTLFRKEPPGDFQHRLAGYLAERLPATAWKQLSGNDDNLCLLIDHPRHDTAQLQLQLHIRYAVGRHRLCAVPNLILEPIGGPAPGRRTIPVPRIASNCKVCGSYFRFDEYLTVPVGALAPGRWRCRIEGTAGPDEQFYWQTNWVEWAAP